MRYQYPLKLSFKLLAMTPQIFVRDANGNDLMYVKQKMFKLKEDIGVFSDSSQTQQLFTIKADRIIDFSAQYHFTSHYDGQPYGSVKRKGMRSLWRASYMIFDPDGQETHHIGEGNPWTKVADGCLGGIPLLGLFSGYLFHPSYIAYRAGMEMPIMRVTKEPAFFEGVFSIHPLDASLADYEEVQLLLSFMMMLLLERRRG